MRLRLIAAACVLLMLGINLAIFASGNMHAHGRHPLRATVMTWIFAAAGYALVVVTIIALRRRWRSPRRRASTLAHRGGQRTAVRGPSARRSRCAQTSVQSFRASFGELAQRGPSRA